MESIEKHSLYRHFDKNDNLLYVGISVDPLNRLKDHKQQAIWFEQISRVDIEKFDNRKDVIRAEIEAIRNEAPVFNVKYNNPIKPKTNIKSKIKGRKTAQTYIGLGPEAIEAWISQDYVSQRELTIGLPRQDKFPGFVLNNYLTKKEKEIVALLGRGLDRSDVCQVLDISRSNLRGYFTRLRKKATCSY